MAKMYYTEEEAAAKLGTNSAELEQYVRDEKLRVYRDGDKKMFKADEVDALAGGAEEEIELAPLESTSDTASLTDADQPPAPAGKEDTVITAEGISIFDDEDLEIEAADPMAKTQIAPSLEDQMTLEGVGSGSGLLDLTRESDNTSLGEVLDNIDMEGSVGEGIAAEAAAVLPPAPGRPVEQPAIVEPVFVEQIDASAGLFGGLAVGTGIVALLLAGIMVALLNGVVPSYLAAMKQNIAIVLVVAVVILGAAGLIGFLVGKSVADRQEAMRRMNA